MNPERTASRSGRENATTTRFFTPQSATQSLVLVRAIVQEIVTGYDNLMRMRTERGELAEAGRAKSERLEILGRDIEQQIERLASLQDELNEIGCDLKDWATGLVDFPALYQGRRVLLCWKLGEPQVSHWHELDGGFAGRKSLDASLWTH